MEGAGVEEGGGGGAEAAALVEVVKADGPTFGVIFFLFEEAHGDAHPEELRGLDAAVFAAGFIDDEVAIVEGLDAEVVEIEVGGGVEGFGEFVEVVNFQQLGIEAFDGDTVFQIGLEGGLVGVFQFIDAIAKDRPIEDFLVDVGEQDAGGELREVGVFFDERLGVEDDGVFEVLGGNFIADRAAEFAFDIGVGDVEVEADGGVGDALAEVGAVPERGYAIVGNDGDHQFLVWILGEVLFFLAHAGAFVAVADVVGGSLEVALAHEFFLNHVLDVLDVDE